MFPSLEQKLHRYAELEKQLEDPMLLSDIDRMLDVRKELGGLTKVPDAVRAFRSLEEDIEAAEMMVEEETDPESKAYARAELKSRLIFSLNDRCDRSHVFCVW